VVLGQGEELEFPLPEQPAERPELGDTAAHLRVTGASIPAAAIW